MMYLVPRKRFNWNETSCSFRIHVLKRVAGQKWRSVLPDIHVVADVLRGYRDAAQDQQALDYVAQFTDISRPAFFLEYRDGLLRKILLRHTGFCAHLVVEVLDQQRNIVTSFVQ